MSMNSPPPGDYTGAATAQARESGQQTAQQTQANRPNISTPFGGQSWQQGPNGEWTLTAGLSPEVQSAYSNLKPFDVGSLGAMPTGDSAREQATTAAYEASLRRMNPQWEGRENSMRQQLANQGIDANSAAGRAAARDFSTARNDAYQGAMTSAIREGAAAGDSAFRNSMASRQQQLAEMLRARGMPLEDLRGLMGFMATPGFNQAGRADPTQYLAALGMGDAAKFRQWQADNQMLADTIGGGAQLVGSLAPFAFGV